MNVKGLKEHPLNPGEAKALKTIIKMLNEAGAKQALYGIVQVLSQKVHLPLGIFEEIVNDALKLTEVLKGNENSLDRRV
jgi:hypothetical protein